MDESQDGGKFLIDGALLHRLGEKNTQIGIPSTTANDGFYLYLSVMEVAENFSSEVKIVGIKSDGGENLRVCREALELKYTNDYFSPHPSPYSAWSALHIYWQRLATRECNKSSRIMVRLTQNRKGLIYRSA